MIKYDYSRAIALRQAEADAAQRNAEAKATALGLRGGYRPRTHEERVREETARRKANDEVSRALAAEEATLIGAITPEVKGLDVMLEEPDDPVVYRVSGLWPVGGRVVLAAQYKAGKTTVVQNLARALADGTTFLGHPVQGPLKVAVIDTEMDEAMLRRQFRTQGVKHPENIGVVPMRGAAGTFDLTSSHVRAMWASRLQGFDVVILDCLRPVLDGIGLDEDREVGKFLRGFDALLKEMAPEDATHAVEGVVVHHAGHNGERARGSSVILDWPDANWRLSRENKDDPRSDRFFSAYGRSVDEGERQILMDARGRLDLSVTGESRAQVRRSAIERAMSDFFRAHEGQVGKTETVEALHRLTGKARAVIRKTVETAMEDGRLQVEAKGAARLLSLSPEFAAQEAESDLEAAAIPPADTPGGADRGMFHRAA